MKITAIQQHPIVRWLIQARRIPLLFGVTIIAGIFYHYAPTLTVVWILLSLLLQSGLFRLFDFVKKHLFLGGAIYCVVGLLFLFAASGMIYLGYGTKGFAPEDPSLQLNFLVWFLTPQSVLTTSYLGYTFALFLLFTFFIASVAYYFTLVRYRVLMSFVVMIFPFAIYAKENETMPIPSIIILLVCYFAVMIYCRQAHAEDSEIVQRYEPNANSTLSMPSKKSAYSGTKPELLDGKFLHAAGMFLAAASIFVLILPKPEVEADRTFLDTMLSFSTLSDYLMNAISGFADSSDGGSYTPSGYSRALYYTKAEEMLNLRIRTFTSYDYDSDSWYASDYDRSPAQSDGDFVVKDGFETVSVSPDPAKLIEVIQHAAVAHPEFAQKWNLETFAGLPVEREQYVYPLEVQSASTGTFVFPVPNHVQSMKPTNQYGLNILLYQSQNEIMFRYSRAGYYRDTYSAEYLSGKFAESDAAQALMRVSSTDTWEQFLQDLAEHTDDALVQDALADYHNALDYAEHDVESHTPASVQALADELMANLDAGGLHSDYDKAMAIRDYLKYNGGFLYSLTYPITDEDNVETFLFKNKTGVCYQFASAMAELCRAAGLCTRYVEGYSMNQEDDRLIGGSQWDYVITTEHAHAFVDVFIAGYGWMMLDATAGNAQESARASGSVIAALQYSGLILFGAALVLIVLLYWIIPILREKWFRRWYQKHRDAEGVQAAFARLRKQWRADPAQTARALCAEKCAFLQVDLSELLAGFEQTVYADHCNAETADRVFQVYCAAYDAWKPAHKAAAKAARQSRKARKKQTA